MRGQFFKEYDSLSKKVLPCFIANILRVAAGDLALAIFPLSSLL